MRTDDDGQRPFALVLLVAFNLIPLVGVLNWGWQSFELIFLYWMENLVIGAFSLVRMVVRPYGHAIDGVFPVLLAPFFAFHYGFFCWGHGTFVVSLFGPEHLNGFDLLATTREVLARPHMLLALGALTLIQVMDWVRDVRQRGFGADGVKDLMVAPYRRIVVLHVTILAAGFALGALDEPTVGLIILVGVKTASDLYHWRHDSQAEPGGKVVEVTPELIREMAEKYPEPVVKVNGREKKFASFAEMKASSEFRMAQAVMRLMGFGRELEALTTYLDMRIEEEQRAP